MNTVSTQNFLLTEKNLSQTTGWVLILESVLGFVPVIILGSSINWPQSLGNPPEVMLPLIQQQAVAVRLGYLAYLAYSILFWVVALLVVRVLSKGQTESAWLRVATGFGLASMVARCLGIIRWLVAMPALAVFYVEPTTSNTAREAIAVIYRTLNDYAGSVGEVLGVSLFAAVWLAIASLHILQTGALPQWLGFFGLVSATLLSVQLAELFGVDLGAFISVSVTVLQLWFLAMGITILRRRRGNSRSLSEE